MGLCLKLNSPRIWGFTMDEVPDKAKPRARTKNFGLPFRL